MTVRLKPLRRNHGWTLEVLAERTGLTKSYLSKVERGLSVPSIAVAMKLAQALGVSTEDLFSEPAGAGGITVVRAGERTAAGAPGTQPRYEGIATQRSGKALLPFMIYPPADFSTSPFKEHDGEELLFVHCGEIEVAFAGQTVRLAVGDSVVFDARIPHRTRSVGAEPAQALVVVSADRDTAKPV
ncbi:XRE family transcriptional regulator [uncultured Ralstonia sp.]|jgi:transcriptional regulator with XRE-family HTH domain|uniref:helix-turn-helix domain-containing protein n=1 Tax=Ralstonia sp. TaxID=54061 RepID=UPI001EA65E92|nr:XRE family transcriptional regulator [uncultured Ralstonia sp.]UCF23768.1 MAG: helix-turn-helix transcriptional regulator [Ralstonia sp.]